MPSSDRPPRPPRPHRNRDPGRAAQAVPPRTPPPGCSLLGQPLFRPRGLACRCTLSSQPLHPSFLNSTDTVPRTTEYISLLEMKQGQCICPLSWSVHCNFTVDGKCNERGWAYSQANFTLMMECTPESSVCYYVYSVPRTVKGTGKQDKVLYNRIPSSILRQTKV